ncbi:MAG: response regulator [Gaiellaceae bacterium]
MEDDPYHARLMRRMLENDGYTVIHAGTGEEGLRLALEYVPDMILLDMGLPDLEHGGEGIRFHPDIRALRRARVWPRQDRAPWPQLTGRQSWVLDRPVSRGWGWQEGRWIPLEATLARPVPGIERLVEADRTVLRVGLGTSDYVRGVRWVASDLDAVARRILIEPLAAPRRVAALLPLAEAAAAGLFAFAVGWQSRMVGLIALVRPRMRFDEEGRLHDWDGLPAAEWPNGKGLYFWHGVEMTESAGSNPDAVTPRRVLGWANAERRRVAIERIGLERFMQAVGAEVIQQDDYGRLWRTAREVDGEEFVAVEVVNSTAELDGTYRRYFLRVPPSVRSARRAVAWTFGLTKRVYEPAVES